MEASNKTDLAVKLREQGYIPTLVEEKNEKSRSASFLSGLGLVSGADKIMFTKNLAVMLSAGLSITRALEILSRQTNNKYFSRTIISLMNDTRKGDFLSSAMKKFPKIFSKLFIAMVKTGEESGQLSESLNLAGGQLEKDYMLMRKVKGAMMYPAIILIAMVLIGIFIVYLCRAHTGGHFQRIECGFASFHPSDYFHKRFCHETHLFVYNFFLGRYFFRRMVFKDRKRENISGKNFIENSAYFSNYQKNKFSQD